MTVTVNRNKVLVLLFFYFFFLTLLDFFLSGNGWWVPFVWWPWFICDIDSCPVPRRKRSCPTSVDCRWDGQRWPQPFDRDTSFWWGRISIRTPVIVLNLSLLDFLFHSLMNSYDNIHYVWAFFEIICIVGEIHTHTYIHMYTHKPRCLKSNLVQTLPLSHHQNYFSLNIFSPDWGQNQSTRQVIWVSAPSPPILWLSNIFDH